MLALQIGNQIASDKLVHESHSHLALGVCRKIPLCGSLCDLRVSVVSVFLSNFTTEAQSITESTQRRTFSRQTPEARCECDWRAVQV